ncbi:MAG: RNA polymerase sigma factor [Candidatus Aminicenantes bacterium]|nr:RNA polymerase sigma factor [Candidatus Aminicenantes bacterium]
MSDKKLLLEFVEKYGGDFMSFALSLVKNRPDAEDACQEMLMQMIRHWEDFDGNKNLKSWAFTILYRKCLDQLKKKRRFLNFFQKVALESEYSVREKTEPESLIQTALSESILSRLKPKERACLLLWAKEGFSSEEISRVMGCRPGTVRVHLYQARKKIKAMMERGNEKKADVPSG